MDTEPQVQEEVQEVVEAQVDPIVEDSAPVETPEPQEKEETQVPLAALQKERKKRQDLEARAHRAEIETQYLKEQFSKKEKQPEEDDYTLEESVTRGDLKTDRKSTKDEILAAVAEQRRLEKEGEWASQFPERHAYVMDNLTQFLNQRPNLTGAISEATNRYKEAYTIMEAFNPRKENRQPARKVAPNSPSAVPKTTAMNQAVDVMSMTDKEFSDWRASKRRR